MRFFNYITLLVTTLLILSCAVTHHIPVQTQTQVQTVLKDSLVIHIDTVTYQIPVESSSAFQVQSSHLETTVAVSEASVDSLGLLTHNLTNKPFKIEKQIVYKDRIVTQYRDSVEVKEVPVEVEKPVKYVPKFYKYLLAFNIILGFAFGSWLFLKFKV